MSSSTIAFDLRTMALTHAVSTVLLSLLLALVARRARRIAGTAGVRAWAAGGFCAGLGLLCTMGQPEVSPWLSFVLGNVLYTVALSLVVFGVRRFKGKPAPAWIAWLPPLSIGVFCVYFGVIAPDVRARIVVVGLVLAALALVGCRELLRPPREALRIPFWFTACAGFVFAVVTIARSLSVLAGHPVTSSLEATPLNVLAYFSGGFAMMSLVVGLILAINYSLLADAERLAGGDLLTGCLNRHGFREAVGVRLAAGGSRLAVLMLDLDRFKGVNDEHGHEAGDRLLRVFAECVRAELPPGALFARLGGEEFCVIPPAAPDRGPGELAEAIRVRFERHGAFRAGLASPVTVSVGIAEGACSEDALRATMRTADLALYDAKRAGRNRVVLATVPPRPALGRSPGARG